MKPTTCSHCGKRLEDDRDTVIEPRESSDSIPSLTSIDKRWETTVHEDPTRIQVVPTFSLPDSFRRRKEVTDSQRPTPMRPPPRMPRQPPRTWLVVVLVLVVGVGLGALMVVKEDAIFRALSHLRR
jgi:hypothetical protein